MIERSAGRAVAAQHLRRDARMLRAINASFSGSA
jgi:hypothetical protein